ncbi:MAG: ligand-binding sensor domain-containing protein, partial [Thermodesulfobacteriota bacterium]
MSVTGRAVLLTFFAGCLVSAFAGSGKSASVTFEHISVEHGLSQVAAKSILQDRKGFLWIGTENGLNRYDGYSFKIFKHRPDDPASIGANEVLALYSDASGTLWAGTDGGGLNRFDPDTETFTRFRHDSADSGTISTDSVGAIHQDRRSNLWVGARWRGALDRFDPVSGRCLRYASDPKNPHGFHGGQGITAIIEDHRGRILIGTDGTGINVLDPATGRFEHWVHDPENPQSLGSDLVTGIFEDRGGTLWITTYGGGLNCRHPDENRFLRYRHNPADPDSIAGDHLRSVYEDRSGAIWIGTDHDGLDRFDRTAGRFIHCRPDPTEP